MSARFNIHSEAHHSAEMSKLRAENKRLREQLARLGVNPDVLLASIARRRKGQSRYGHATQKVA